MKADLLDVNDTRKSLKIEVPSEIVDERIDRVAKDYSRKARIPGFRPGKVPSRVIKQRFRDQILHDVAHDLVPQAIDDALRERGVEPVSPPDVTDVNVQEGAALTFTASFDTLPPFDLGDYATLSVTRPADTVGEEAVDQALERLRQRAAKFEPVDGRGIVEGDFVALDLERAGADGEKESASDVTIEMGGAANPPGFDAQLLGLDVGATKTFTLRTPDDAPNGEVAGTEITYTVTVKAIKRRLLAELDDEFAKDMGDFETLDALRQRVREDLEHEARHTSERSVRGELMRQIGARVPFDLPESLIDRELDRRVEDFVARLLDQNIDPRKANIDWKALRDAQRDDAKQAVSSALALDELARREQLVVDDVEIEKEIARYAAQSGRTPAAVRASLERDGGISRVHAGLRREKSIDFLIARATISSE